MRRVLQSNARTRFDWPAQTGRWFSAYEINTNGRNVGFCVGVIRKSEKQTRLSDTGVSNEEKFEEVIAVCGEEMTAKTSLDNTNAWNKMAGINRMLVVVVAVVALNDFENQQWERLVPRRLWCMY